MGAAARIEFQHTAARRRLGSARAISFSMSLFQHTAARRRLSRALQAFGIRRCFNTQPPEGGWQPVGNGGRPDCGFNTQPPEGGWRDSRESVPSILVSTHSRPKAAARPRRGGRRKSWFQHTAARRRLAQQFTSVV